MNSVSFFQTPDNLQIHFETERLIFKSFEESDTQNSIELYGDERITPYFDHGKPRSPEEVQQLVNEIGLQRFEEGSPYGLFSAYKKDNDQFVGQFDILPRDPGELEIGYIISFECQRQGYGSEIAKGIIEHYVPALKSRNYTANGAPIQKIVATVLEKNIGSKKILEKIGMIYVNTIEKIGWDDRHFYSMTLES